MTLMEPQAAECRSLTTYTLQTVLICAGTDRLATQYLPTIPRLLTTSSG